MYITLGEGQSAHWVQHLMSTEKSLLTFYYYDASFKAISLTNHTDMFSPYKTRKTFDIALKYV